MDPVTIMRFETLYLFLKGCLMIEQFMLTGGVSEVGGTFSAEISVGKIVEAVYDVSASTFSTRAASFGFVSTSCSSSKHDSAAVNTYRKILKRMISCYTHDVEI